MLTTETVYRLRSSAVVDPYSGDPDAEDWTSPARLRILTLAPAEPRPSQEPQQDARNAVTSGFTLYIPEASDVTAADRMEVRGRVYRVLGDPAVWAGFGMVVQTGETVG